MGQFIHELRTEKMSNGFAAKAAMDAFYAEQRRKERSLMSDTYNLDCSRNPPSEPFRAEQDAMRAEAARQRTAGTVSDPVNQPAHYRAHPSGVECITITEHMGFNLGNALKYIWRCDLKKDALEDLRKAEYYIKREIAKREKAAA